MRSVAQHSADENNSSTGDNLLLLMDLSPASSVLVVGDNLITWCHFFQNAHFAERVPTPVTGAAAYELILYHSATAKSRVMLQADLQWCRELLSPQGSILFFAENSFSFANLKKLVGGRGKLLVNQLWYRHYGYQQALNCAGFPVIESFVPLPGLAQPEELVGTNSKMLELPHNSSPLDYLAHRFGGYATIAEGHIFWGGQRTIQSSHLLRTVAEEIARQLQLPAVNCSLERLDIRVRGALVLFLHEMNSGRGFIARLVAAPAIDKIVGKNHAILEYLHAEVGLPEAIKHKLPRPICRLTHAGSSIYVETMVPGIPAWKINRNGLRERIFRDAVDFLWQVHFATRRTEILSEEKLHKLFADDRARLANCPVIADDFRVKVDALINALQNSLRGLDLDLVISHGDYGYGNILVDAQSGTMHGVIDWDTARQSDFSGVDLLNLLVQKERAEKCCPVLPAFTAVINGGGTTSAGNEYRNLLTLFEIPELLHDRIVCLSFIRYISRAAQYPQVFQEEQNDYRQILDLLLERVPL